MTSSGDEVRHCRETTPIWVVPLTAVCKTVGIISEEVASWSVTITTHHIEVHLDEALKGY